MDPLTVTEQQFADEHHEIVYKYLRFRRLRPEEYYDVVIFRYLRAVHRYLNEPDLRKYKFDTIACGGMRSALYNHFRSERLRRSLCVTNTELVERLQGDELE
jgi:RNA polymerase sigma-70 factor (ECF subfamily)